MSEIYLIRHGQASFGEKDYDRLSPIGCQQSQVLAKHLLDLEIEFDAVYSGRMKRQLDTATPFCNLLSAKQPALGASTIDASFDEYDAGALLYARSGMVEEKDAITIGSLKELRSDKRAFQTYFADTLNRWVDGEYDHVTGVETWNNFCKRIENGLKRIVSKHGRGKRLAVFTSGGPITAAVKMVLGLTDRTAVELNWQIMNASLTCIKTNGASFALATFNSTTHLRCEKKPSLLTYR